MQGLGYLVEHLRHRSLEEYLGQGSRLLGCLEVHLRQLLPEYSDRGSRLLDCSGVHRKRRVGQFLVHLPLVPIRMPHRLGFSVKMPRHKLS